MLKESSKQLQVQSSVSKSEMDPIRLATDRLIRLPEVLSIIPISRSKVYEEIKNGRFPAPQKIGSRIAVWRYSAICALSHTIGS